MKTKNKIIIGVIIIIVALLCITLLWINPLNERKQVKYEAGQQDSSTHDIAVIEEYKSPYMGNASNMHQLFENLPLGNVEKKYEIDSKRCILKVKYSDDISNIEEQKVHQNLIYNAVAAMAAVENLSEITYEFSGDSLSVTRKQVEKVFGGDLSLLLNPKVWNENVQKKISEKDFLAQFY